MARDTDCTNVHPALDIAGVQKGCLDVHDISLASGNADVLGYEVSPANECCCGTGKRVLHTRHSHVRSLHAVASAVGQWRSSMVTSFSWRSAIVELSQSLTQASSSRGSLFGFRKPWSTVRVKQRAFGGMCAFAVRERCRELASAFGRVFEETNFKKLKVHPCQVACASLHRARVRVGVFQFGRGCDTTCLKGESG